MESSGGAIKEAKLGNARGASLDVLAIDVQVGYF